MKIFARCWPLALLYSSSRPWRGRVVFHYAALILIFLFVTLAAAAQETPRFEVGGAFTVLNHSNKANVGPGVTGVWNVGRFLSVEGSVNWFPHEAGFSGFISKPLTETTSSAVEALFGAKVGYRTRRFGVFAKVRPGLISAGNAQLATGFLPHIPGFGPNPFDRFGRLTEKALDFGGVVEYYPAKHWAVRVDVGDTLIFEEGFVFQVGFPGGITSSKIGGGTTSHFQLSTGVHFRF